MGHLAADQPPDAVLLAGPTASGKSGLAAALAARHRGTVIDADSMQVYADLDVLSARPDAAAMALAPHRLYGHVDGATAYSVARWRADAAEALVQTRLEERLPILVGGTGLYFRAAERGLAEVPAVPPDLQATLRAEALGMSSDALHARLATLDPAAAATLRPSDPQRILRALEVVLATGRPLSSWQADTALPPLLDPARCIRLFLAPDAPSLRRRIELRFDAMMAGGAVEELRRLAGRGLDPALPVMRALGVRQLLAALQGSTGWDEAVAQAKTQTWRYAKRQFTWFRHQMPGWRWISPETAEAVAEEALAAGR